MPQKAICRTKLHNCLRVVYVFSLFGNSLNEAFKIVTHISLTAVKDTTHFPFLSNPWCKHMIALFDSRRFAKKMKKKTKRFRCSDDDIEVEVKLRNNKAMVVFPLT